MYMKISKEALLMLKKLVFLVILNIIDKGSNV